MNDPKEFANVMMRAAAEYWRANVKGISAEDAAETIVKHLRLAIRPTLDEAFRDAQAANTAGMPAAASATFQASLRLGGIKAAKAAAAELGVAK